MAKKSKSTDANRVRGSIMEALGKMTGDVVTQCEGAAQKRDAEIKAAAALKQKQRETKCGATVFAHAFEYRPAPEACHVG